MTESYCFLCGRNGKGDPLERHHIFNGSLRKKSERYGLVVFLCGDRCHRNGAQAAHQCAETRKLLSRYGQQQAMKEQGWTVEEFIKQFGQNYILED